MKHKDERAKLTSAILSDIKVITLYGWEKTFTEKVLGIWKQELQALKRCQILFSASSFFPFINFPGEWFTFLHKTCCYLHSSLYSCLDRFFLWDS